MIDFYKARARTFHWFLCRHATIVTRNDDHDEKEGAEDSDVRSKLDIW